MLEIEMPKDIKNYEPKILGPLTLRQLVCLGISLSYGIPFVLFTHGDIVVRIMVGLALMVPVLLCGWLKVYNEPFEKFIKIIIINKFVKPEKRKYKCREVRFEEEPAPIKKVKRSKNIKGYK